MKVRASLLTTLVVVVLVVGACTPEVVTQEVIITQEVPVTQEVLVTQEVEVVVTEQVIVTQEVTAVPETYAPITIDFWYALGGTQGQLLQALIDEFNATNQYQITVNATFSGDYGETAQKVVAGLESGELPAGGLIAAGPLWTCREGNYLIEDYISGPEGLVMDDYWEVLWDYNRYEGHICSLPFNNSTMVMYYNQDLMTQAGLDPAAPPTTWEELLTQAKAVQAAVPGTIGVEVRDEGWWLKALMLQNGGEIMNADSTEPLFNSPEAVGAMEYWKQLIDEGVMPPVQHGDSRDLFLAGQIAFWMSSTGNIGRVKDGAQFQWSTAFLPCNVECGGTVGGAALVLFPTDDDQQLATWRLLKWLVSPATAATWTVGTGYVPILKSSIQSAEIQVLFQNEPYFRTGFDQLEVASQYPHFWEMGTLDELFVTAIEQVELGLQTPSEALNEAVAALKADMGQ
jgi:sn-glycerol 3-phosphate transport system substrate-binding protein